ncbi:MAG: hypothetical protein BWY57_03196 [Betaproteobacteria bacterium ADurb.Bin341]|nr:MAG: hypothetical protein BWY57_03196 [Betaproteobacteria bacterium ADurb.Bin341]
MLADERRVAENVGTLVGRQDRPPVEPQGVAEHDAGGLAQRQTNEILAERLGKAHVHLVVHEPHRHFGDAGGPLLDLDAGEGVHVHLRQRLDVQLLLHLFPEQRLEDFDLKQAQLAVGDDEEVAAAARRIEEPQLAQPLVELPEHGLAAPGLLELRPQGVHEERVNDLEDIAFRGVMSAGLAALLGVHHALEERAENRGGDARPVEVGAGHQRVAHGAVEVGEAQPLFEQLAVDVREGGEQLVEVLLATLGQGVQHLEEAGQMQAEVGAIFGRLVLDVEREGLGLEEARILRKEAEEDPHQEALKVMPGVATFGQRVVQVAQDLHGLDIDRVFLAQAVLLVARDEGELVNVLVQFLQRELGLAVMAGLEQRQV